MKYMFLSLLFLANSITMSMHAAYEQPPQHQEAERPARAHQQRSCCYYFHPFDIPEGVRPRLARDAYFLGIGVSWIFCGLIGFYALGPYAHCRCK